MNSIKRSIALLLGSVFVFGMFSAFMAVAAAETATELRITFVGDEADKPGFAQSIISVTPGDGAPVSGYYLVYYTDGNETLENYDELASIPMTDGGTVTYNVPDGIMIPVGAKGIAVFESTTRFLDSAPSLKDAVATAEIPESKQLTSLGTPEFSFGAVSDVHMNYEQYERGAYQKWANALEFYSKAGIEYVIVAGDMTGDRGETPDLEEQYQQYLDILNASDIAFDNVIECIGNHGNTSADIGLFTQYLTGAGEVHPYENSPYFHVLLKGDSGERDNLFIIMRQEIDATGESSTKDNFSEAQIDWLEGLLEAYADTDTNIFILEHSPFLNYGAGDRKNGGYTAVVTFKEEYPQTMRLKGLLETYKDVILMSGHTHVSLYDGCNYSDEYNEFARTVHIGSTSQPCGYGGGSVYTRSTDGRYEVTPDYGSEGYTVEVYSDYIVYTGYNLSTGKIIPAACLLIPTKAYGGPGNPNLPKDPSDVFEGSGTVDDPYIIASADDFMAFTAGFNASSSTVQSEMYGYGKYFLQTADIDMTNYYGYEGTEANGNGKCYFAGIYNGNGYSLNVNINGTNQRSVFPYVYGTICNLVIKGSVTSEVSAQPVRTLYGSIINCVFDVDVFSNQIANGIIYSNYGYVYNVYSFGSMTGTDIYPVASNDTSKNYFNVYYSRTAGNGTELSDEYGTKSSDLTAIAAAFNNKSASGYTDALSKLGGFEIREVSVINNCLVFAHSGSSEAPETKTYALGDINTDGTVNQYDYILAKRAHFNTVTLTDVQKRIGDMNGDNLNNQYDYILVKRIHFKNYSTDKTVEVRPDELI